VRLAIFDVAGRRIRTLCDGRVAPAGVSTVVWDGTADDGRELPAGIYLCRLMTPGFESARGMVVKMVKRH
jgi:flagellar hook assembly protein FlgD